MFGQMHVHLVIFARIWSTAQHIWPNILDTLGQMHSELDQMCNALC